VRSYFERLEDTEAFVHPDGYVSEDSGNVLYSDLITEPHDHECAECKENVSEFFRGQSRNEKNSELTTRTMTDTTQETYEVKVQCTNCTLGRFVSNYMKIKKGQLVEQTPCPRCRCTTLTS